MVDKDSNEFMLGQITQQVQGIQDSQMEATRGIHRRLDKFEDLIPQVAKNSTRITIHAWVLRTIGASFLGGLIMYIKGKISGS